VSYRDILGLEQSVAGSEIQETLKSAAKALAQEIAQRVTGINGAPPSAMFLAGGGSKLLGLRELVAQELGMDERRVALAGNNYDISAFSREYELNDPEFATPLGIAVSAGLGLISDSYRIMLNGKPAKLFRSGTLTVLDLLMMNGYTSADLVGRTGRTLSVTVDGQRLTFRGESAMPCTLRRNGEDTKPSALVYAGDSIEFTPAVPGASAERTPADLLGVDYAGGVLVNGRPAALDTPLRSGDQVISTVAAVLPEEPEPEPEEAPISWQSEEKTETSAIRKPLFLYLNGEPLVLPGKQDGGAYFLMDLLDRSGIDFETLDVPLVLQVNGADCPFTQELRHNDQVVIRRGQ
ncbi:MAG: cell division protein FtsA, partial [Oscillospiraceae bacterium]|nr:cell division protein FtsA [Oscillospiraceae bacterium]